MVSLSFVFSSPMSVYGKFYPNKPCSYIIIMRSNVSKILHNLICMLKNLNVSENLMPYTHISY